MRTAIVDYEKCPGGNCDQCMVSKACPKRAVVRLEPGEGAFIDRTLCNGCGDCIVACPSSAVVIIDT